MAKADDTRLRIKCAALSFASDHGSLAAARRGDDAAQGMLADSLISKLHQAGLEIVRMQIKTAACPHCGNRQHIITPTTSEVQCRKCRKLYRHQSQVHKFSYAVAKKEPSK